jgi:hypothetical protein
MKFAFVILTLVLGQADFAVSQTKTCTVTASTAPELRGFKLGMTVEQVKVRTDMWPVSFGSVKEDETGFFEARRRFPDFPKKDF